MNSEAVQEDCRVRKREANLSDDDFVTRAPCRAGNGDIWATTATAKQTRPSNIMTGIINQMFGKEEDF